MSKHSPGDWYCRPEEPMVEGITDEGYTFTIADCSRSYVLDYETQKANARVIGALPNLLNALETLLFNCRHGNGAASWQKSIDDAALAIAKAKGEG